MHSIKSYSSFILLSSLIFALGTYLFFQNPVTTFDKDIIIHSIPWFLLGTAFVLSLKFRRQEAGYFSLMVFGLLAFFSQYSTLKIQHSFSFETLTLGVVCLFYVNFVIFQLSNIKKALSISSAIYGILLFAQLYLGYWILLNDYQPAAELLTNNFIPDDLLKVSFAPDSLLICVLLALSTQLIRIAIQPDKINAGIFASLLAISLIQIFPDYAFLPEFIFSLIGLILITVMIQSSFDMAFIDTLTQLPSRRVLEQELAQLGRKYSIAMLDVDHFKKINDRYGHAVGDQVLRKIARHLKFLGGDGIVTRYGGEEFAIVFPGKTVREVLPHLEALRAEIELSSFNLRSKKRPKQIPATPKHKDAKINNIKVTVSLGVAERSRLFRDSDQVQKAADSALYKAKKRGRNQICF